MAIQELFKKKLASQSRAILAKYKPKVIGITGSVGKTSAKEAIFAALSSIPGVAASKKNFNNEFGVPFSILQLSETPGKNPVKWISAFAKGSRLQTSHKAYPKILILELGIDHPGDMDYLADLVKPTVAVLTAIGVAHIGYFGSEESILKEKQKILQHLGKDGVAVINYEDLRLRESIAHIKHDFISYGFHAAADVRAELINTAQIDGQWGTAFTLSHKEHRQPVFIPGVIGKAHVLAYLAGVSVALAMRLPFEQAVINLRDYNPQPGRMHLLQGINRSLIIDDSYNSSPQAVRLALEELKNFPAGIKIAVLGDMRELGKFSIIEHQNLAESLLDTAPDKIVLVGLEIQSLLKQLLKMGYPQNDLLYFKDSKTAAKSIGHLADPDTVFLVKGSQNVIRLERVVKALLRNKDQAEQLLVRQSHVWKRIK